MCGLVEGEAQPVPYLLPADFQPEARILNNMPVGTIYPTARYRARPRFEDPPKPPEPKHFPVQPQCDVCAEDMIFDETAVGRECSLLPRAAHVAAKHPSTVISHFDTHTVVLRPAIYFRFSRMCHSDAMFPPYKACRDPTCEHRQMPRRWTATSHVQCYKFMVSRCERDGTLHLPGVSLAWRQPWKAAEALRLRAPPSARWGLKLVGEVFDMPALAGLPAEIAEMIRVLCEGHIIWRFARIAELVDSLKGADEFPVETLPLREVDAWERGKEATLERNVFGPIKKPFIRLTVDFRGLQKIERLAELPTSDEVRSDACAYAFDLDRKGDDGATQIHFQVCTLSSSTLALFPRKLTPSARPRPHVPPRQPEQHPPLGHELGAPQPRREAPP